MLIHRHDDGTADESRWRGFVAAQGFGHLVAGGKGRSVPVAVPTQFLLDGELVMLHLARPNPLFEALDENPRALLSVAGDWAYIPGSWKAIDSEDPRQGIPTTYYGAVQMIGTMTVIDDPEEVARILRLQLEALEPGKLCRPARPWCPPADDPSPGVGDRRSPCEVQIRRKRRRCAPCCNRRQTGTARCSRR